MLVSYHILNSSVGLALTLCAAIIKAFNFGKAVKYQRPKPATHLTDWKDDTCRMAVSGDGIPLVYYLPRATPLHILVSYYTPPINPSLYVPIAETCE